MAVERATIQPIPDENRHGTFRYLFYIWFGCNMSLLTVVTGALATTSFGLGFLSSSCAIILGLLIGTVFMALHAAQGPQLGLPQMVQTRGQFGAIGGMLVFAAVILMYVGFIAIEPCAGRAITSLRTGWRGARYRDHSARDRRSGRRDFRL